MLAKEFENAVLTISVSTFGEHSRNIYRIIVIDQTLLTSQFFDDFH